MEDLVHFAYDHPLELLQIPPDSMYWCKICGDEIRGEAYCSEEVSLFGEPKFIIHEKCGQLPKEVKHSFHYHSLVLSGNQPPKRCDMCKRSAPFLYCCPGCDYRLDVKCASLTPRPVDSISDSMVRCERSDKFEYSCDVCLTVIEGGVVYYDSMTSRLLHESCASLAVEIDHPFHQFHHPSHPLTLMTVEDTFSGSSKSFTCNACGRESLGHYYRCSECEFYLDVNCALLVVKDESLDKLVHTHKHPLIRCELARDRVISCSGCEKLCKSAVYICTQCHLVLDESCTQLVPKIKHPFHVQHHLFLVRASKASSLCKACEKAMRGFIYACTGCMAVHATCAFPIPPTLKSDCHRHPLVFLDKADTYFKCNVCRRGITDPFCCCLQCNYYLHICCIPDLPKEIFSDTHDHPYLFEDSLPKVAYLTVCKVCDKLVKSVEHVYCCGVCGIYAHPHCFIDQILSHYKAEALQKEEALKKAEEARKQGKTIEEAM